MTPSTSDGVIVVIEKQTEDQGILNEKSFVNLKTKKNISFSKGFLALKLIMKRAPLRSTSKNPIKAVTLLDVTDKLKQEAALS